MYFESLTAGSPTYINNHSQREPTFDVVGVVDDKVPVPNHRQVHRQVTDVIALVGVL